MFLLRGLIGLVCITVGMVGMLVAFNRPVLVIVPLVFVPLGLWAMGYISRLAPMDAQLRNYAEEQAIRKGRYYGLRIRLMGGIAVAFGGLTLFVALMVPPDESIKMLLGGLLFAGFGLWYLIKGAEAEELHPPTFLRRRGVTAKMLKEQEAKVREQWKEHYDLLEQIEDAKGVISPEHAAKAAELLKQLEEQVPANKGKSAL